jgi:GNAT superfamily N-acetyltransferase
VSDFEVRPEPYDGPVVADLVTRVQQEYVERYGGPDEAFIDAAQFTPPAGLFLVGFLADEPVACGGVRVVSAAVAEIKRMFVVRSARGRGLSRVMLGALEDAARELGCRQIVLETGMRQPEAVSLYETSGYQRIMGFGHYQDSPLSLAFAKDL